MKKLIFITLSLVSLSISAYDQSIVPENDLWIPAGVKSSDNVMTESEFTGVIDAFEAAYKDVVTSKGGVLKVYRKWSTGTVNAYASRSGRYWKIYMFGGLARHEKMTTDAFSLVVCHELGHHMGGSPISSWASIEGQADYWATAKCLRNVWQDDNNVEIMSRITVDPLVATKCAANFSLDQERAICQRTAMAGLTLGEVFQSLRNSSDKLSFATPDPNVVEATDTKHPASQCRLDTYLAGAICDISKNDEVSSDDAEIGVCTRLKNYQDGVRPLCWYKPQES